MEQISTCSQGKAPQARAGGFLKEAVTLLQSPALEQASVRTCRPMERGTHAISDLLAGLMTPWEPMVEQPLPAGLHPVEGAHAGAVCEELQPVGRTHVEDVCGELSPVRGTFKLEKRKSVRSSPLRRKE